MAGGTRGVMTNDNSGTQPVVMCGEVVDVVLNKLHPFAMASAGPLLIGGIDIGYVKVKWMGTETKMSRGEAAAAWVPPLNRNISTYPIKGELVACIQAPNLSSQLNPKNQSYYWFDIVNAWGDINFNAIPNASFASSKGTNSKGINFAEKDIEQMQHYSGDLIIQGRFDSAIRIGNSQPTGLPINTWSIGSTKGDPIMILSNGHDSTKGKSHIEDINKDDSTIILTSKQKINLKPANEIASEGFSAMAGPTKPMTPIGAYIQKPQVIINSERLIFNATKDNIIISAKKEVSVSTKKWKINMSGLADILLETLKQLGMETHPTPCGPSGPPINKPIYEKLKSSLEKMKQ